MYHKEFGKNPKEVYLNQHICNKYHHHCYNYYGDVVVLAETKSTAVSKRVANSRELHNTSNVEATHTIELSASMQNYAGVKVTEASSFSYGGKISIGSEKLGVCAEFKANFTIENSVESTDSDTKEIRVTDKITTTLKPGEKVKAEMYLEWDTLTQKFKIPFTIAGWIGADFGHKVHGHYYWFFTLASGQNPEWDKEKGVLPKFHDSYLYATVESAYNIRGKSIVKTID